MLLLLSRLALFRGVAGASLVRRMAAVQSIIPGTGDALTTTTARASCFCGDVSVSAAAAAVEGISICHCSVCRRLSGAPCMVSVILPRAEVPIRVRPETNPRAAEARCKSADDAEPLYANWRRWSGDIVLLEVKAGAATTELATSKHVVRLRCSKCASPVMARLGKNKAVLPLGLFLEPPPEWKPQHHLHYEDRIFDVDDGLPKWAGRFGQTACDARGDAVATGAAPAAAEPAVAAPAAGGEGKTAGKSKPPAAPTVMVPEPPAPPLEPAAADTTDSRLVAMPRHALTFLTDAQYAQWEAQGFLAIPNVVPADLCKKASDAIYDYVGADRGEPESWYRNVLDIYADKTADGNSPHHGPCGMAQLCHDDALWEIRQCPAMHEVFSDVYGTRRLYVTADRCHFKPPEDADHAAWSDAGAVHSGLHWDLDPSRLPVPFVVQGVVYLEDTPADRGALRVVPGSHRRANECRKLRDSDAAALDGDAVAISGGPGTLVLWHSGALHGPGRNVGATPRVSAYVAMLPVNARLFLGAAAPHDAALSLADAGTLAYDAGPVSRLSREARVKRWRDRLPLLDEDPRESDLARPPRGDAQAFAGLTPLGRRLVGLDDWPEDEPGH